MMDYGSLLLKEGDVKAASNYLLKANKKASRFAAEGKIVVTSMESKAFN